MHYIVASADNTAYFGWQSKLFHWSCVTHAGAVPLIVVHGDGHRPLHPSYLDIARLGGTVVRAGSFRRSAAGDRYAPRNTPGTLLSAAELCDDPEACFVLCDADMIFTRRPAFARWLSADRYDWMNPQEPRVQAMARRVGVTPEEIARRGAAMQTGVPHVVPAAIAREFAETWLDVIDLVPERGYVDSMYAFGLAAAALELEVLVTSHMMTDFDPDLPARADMIHYGYGDARWSKRDFMTDERAGLVWSPPEVADAASVRGVLSRQLREAGAFYASGVPAPRDDAAGTNGAGTGAAASAS